ncbi:MAG TPA: hypothetical protein VFE61_16270 [Candidatus Sulfotelmatobacter sp.]|jgi:hypothetical protein|nr:hypothetical protein [Candidatus Sulfotelmatobacter sp.]
MQLSFEATLIEILRQALVDNAKVIELGGHQFPLRSTPKSGLRQVDFVKEAVADPDLASLQNLPEFRALVKQYGQATH